MVVYDGECRFCLRWALRWRRLAGTRLDFVPGQRLGARLPELDRDALHEAVHLVEPGGRVSRGGAAWLRLGRLAAGDPPDRPLDALRLPAFALAYRLGAGHRGPSARLAPLLFGRIEVPETWQRSRTLFLRGLALVYAVAFASFGVQAQGLVGSRGILPAGAYLERVRELLGSDAWLRVPSLFWLAPNDAMLAALWIAGIAVAGLAFAGLAPMLTFGLLWLLYLSVFSIGQAFLSFQWDVLLLEAGFLAIWYAPPGWRLDSPRAPRPSRLARFLLVWLLARLVFESGLTKLLSGDRSWLDGSALTHHWFTQPLPTWTSWWMAQAPDALDRLGVAAMFAVELGAPALLLLPRVPRTLGALAIAGLMAGIAATGNYGFFNLLTVVLCLAALDDGVWARVLPGRRAPGASLRQREAWPKRLAVAAVAVVVLPLGLVAGIVDGARTAGRRVEAPTWAATLAPFQLANAYGLFRIMTVERPEVVVEASADGVTWQPYVFRHKAGPLARRPGFVGPHMPRLDWQMWFAALRGRPPGWFGAFARRLLEAEPAVLALLESSPGGSAPPRFLRARLESYRFTNRAERRASGQWWKSQPLGVYLPVVRGRPGR